MIKLNVNEKKEIKFNVSVTGIDQRDLTGSLKLFFEEIEYGFKINVFDGQVIATIPPLNSFLKPNLNEGQIIDARLDIVADNTFITPWEDRISIVKPIKVEATIQDVKTIEEKIKPTIKINEILESVKKEKKIKKVKGNKPKSIFRKNMEKK